MRALSFIPAFLLAAASFVAAAPSPAPAPALPVATRDLDVQVVVDIVVNATNQIQSHCNDLTSIVQAGGNINVDSVSADICAITDIVVEAVAQLKASVNVNLNVDLSDLCTVISTLVCLLVTLLHTVLALVGALSTDVVLTLKDVICNLLTAVGDLGDCLTVFITATISGALNPILTTLTGAIQLVLCTVNAIA